MSSQSQYSLVVGFFLILSACCPDAVPPPAPSRFSVAETAVHQDEDTATTPEAAFSDRSKLPIPQDLLAVAGSKRIDLYWSEPLEWHHRDTWHFEVEARNPAQGDVFHPAHEGFLDLPAISLFTNADIALAFRVRLVDTESGKTSPWSDEASAITLPYDPDRIVEEVQQACVRYFRNYRHPISGLPREGIGGWNRNMISIAASGMMFYNLATGIENGWFSRHEGVDQALQALRFLEAKAERYHGMFAHWIHGATGETIPFSELDDGADLVESSFLIGGALFFREYLRTDPSLEAEEIRAITSRLWRDMDWAWFVKVRGDGRRPLLWHWSPRNEFAMNLEITGFNECQLTYLLGLASPTHPIDTRSYTHGWLAPGYGYPRTLCGVDLELGREPYGPPLFFTHYSYLGIDPRVFRYGSKSYFEHFQDFCQIQKQWAIKNRPEIADDRIWGMTASMDPDGYAVHHPDHDNGTFAPTAMLASMPYDPEAVREGAAALYEAHGHELWGPFGFMDAFNLKRNWFSHHYVAIDVGPIAPMIENWKTRLGWDTFMASPEYNRAMERLRDVGIP